MFSHKNSEIILGFGALFVAMLLLFSTSARSHANLNGGVRSTSPAPRLAAMPSARSDSRGAEPNNMKLRP